MAVDTPAQLPLKGLHLLVLVGLVPVEVNTHLANGDPLMTDELLLQLVKSLVTQSCPTLSDPMDCSLPGSSIHGIFQARVLEWGAIAFSAN